MDTDDQTRGKAKKLRLTLVHPDDLRTEEGIDRFLDHLESLGFKFKDEPGSQPGKRQSKAPTRKKRPSA